MYPYHAFHEPFHDTAGPAGEIGPDTIFPLFFSPLTVMRGLARGLLMNVHADAGSAIRPAAAGAAARAATRPTQPEPQE